MASLRLPPRQRAVLAAADAHPGGLVPPRPTVHPGTWSALADRLFIDGPAGREHITDTGVRALRTGRTIDIIPVWQFRWACVLSDLCVDRRTRRAVGLDPATGTWRLLVDHGAGHAPVALHADRDTALRKAAHLISRGRMPPET